MNLDAAAHRICITPVTGSGGCLPTDVIGQLAIERHFGDCRAIDHLNPAVAHAVVTADNVEMDVGQNAAERVSVLLVAVFRSSSHAATVHRGAAAAAAFGAIADLDHLGHLRHRRVGASNNLQVAATGDFRTPSGNPTTTNRVVRGQSSSDIASIRLAQTPKPSRNVPANRTMLNTISPQAMHFNRNGYQLKTLWTGTPAMRCAASSHVRATMPGSTSLAQSGCPVRLTAVKRLSPSCGKRRSNSVAALASVCERTHGVR